MLRKGLFYSLMFCLTTVQAQDLGKATYDAACQACHAPNLAKAIKAPAAFDKKAWQTRFAKAKVEAKKNPGQFKTPMDYLIYSVTIGKGLMQHGGLCHEMDAPEKDCSPNAYVAAIKYMSKTE